MALVPCRECGKKISTEARSCIGCGAPNPTSRPRKTSKNLSELTLVDKIKEFINGHYSLAFSWWIIGTFLWIVISVPAIYFRINGTDDVSETLAFFLILYFIFHFVFQILVILGIWRSAGFYIQENKPPFWGYTARVFLVFAIIGLFLQIIALFSN